MLIAKLLRVCATLLIGDLRFGAMLVVELRLLWHETTRAELLAIDSNYAHSNFVIRFTQIPAR